MPEEATLAEPLAPERGFAHPAVSRCMDLVPALVAVLDERGEALWFNARWRNADTGVAAGAFAVPPRRSLVERARQSHMGLRFREWRGEQALVTTLLPLPSGRILALSAPAALWSAPPHEANVEEIDAGLDKSSPAASLSDRELDVARLLLEGLTIRGVAERLSLSVKTVEGHRDSIYRKLSVRNRAGFAAAMARAGFVAARDRQGSA